LRHFRCILVCVGALICARHAFPRQVSPPESAAEAPARSALIYVVRRSWHIDIGFAADDMNLPLQSLTKEFPQVRYLFFGFGDRRYLLSKSSAGPTLLLALWPGRAMLLATALESEPQAAFGAPHVIALTVTAQQALDAQAFIWQTLDRQTSDSGIETVNSYAAGPYEGSWYFSATPTYSALHTCNTWAAEALKAAGLPIHSTGVVLAGQLWTQVRHLRDAHP
jgi:hypothetical protein